MDEHKKKTGKKKKIIAGAVIAVIVLGLFFSCSRKGKQAAEEAMSEQIVTVTADKGSISKTISGSGNLESEDMKQVKLPVGIKIDKVYVESGDTVKKGDKLAKLNKVSLASALLSAEDSLDDIEDQLEDEDLSSLEEEVLQDQKSELKDYISELKSYRKNPVVKAKTSGVVMTVNVAEDEETGTASSGTSASSGSVSSFALQSEESGSRLAVMLDAAASSAEQVTITDFSSAIVAAPATGETLQEEIPESDCFSGTLFWYAGTETVSDDMTAKAETIYTAALTLTAKDGYVFSNENMEITNGFAEEQNLTDANFSISDDGSQLSMFLTFEETEAETPSSEVPSTEVPSTETPSADSLGGSDADISSLISGSSDISSYASSGSISGLTGSDVTAAAGTSSASADVTEMTAFEIDPQEEVSVTLSVDELDIVNVEKGQEAVVTLDALEGETFTGTVTSVAASATEGSGSVKYAVKVTMPMSSGMRIGMSASAQISIDEAEDVIVIPMEAISQQGDELCVYTSESEGELTDPVIVTTGLSDGTNVEITGGLNEGDQICYKKAEAQDALQAMFEKRGGSDETSEEN